MIIEIANLSRASYNLPMDWLEITLFIVTLIIMLIGLFGTVLPIIPGTPMILIAAAIYGLITDFQDITGKTLAIFALMTGAALLLDWAATVFGVKKMGGSYFGVVGALIGMIAGLLIAASTVVGIIIGSFVGAIAFELMAGKKMKTAVKAGFGSFIGFLFGGVIKFALAATMIGIFIWQVLGE